MSNQKQQNQDIPTIVCLGEALIDFIAETPGALSRVTQFKKCSGGAPANVAVGVARLGANCGFIGKVGLDPFGEFLIETLQQNGVNTRGIIRTHEAPTALAFVSRTQTGDRDFFFYRNPCADILLRKEELPQEWLQASRFLHVGGVSLTQDPSRQTTLYATQTARAHGATISFDPNLRLNLWENDLDECRRVTEKLLSVSDIFLPSEEELLQLMGTNDLNVAIERVLKLGPKIVCVKQGAAGIQAARQLERGDLEKFHQPAFTVPVVDTTGAGDGFNAGFLNSLIKGLGFREALYQGCAVAAFVVTQIGAMSALPTQPQLDQFLMDLR